MTAGIAEPPGVEFIFEHAGLAVLFRATYKSFDGSNRVREPLERCGMITGDATAPIGAAGAMT